MTEPVFSLPPDGKILTVRIAMRFRRRGGRKEIIVPAAELPEAPPDKRGEQIPDDSPVMTLALARAWSRRVDAGETPDDIARIEKRSVSYVHRVLRLTLLAPDIVVAIATGRWVPAKPLTRLDTLPANWEEQRALLGITNDCAASV
jgi:hypothetical protein